MKGERVGVQGSEQIRGSGYRIGIFQEATRIGTVNDSAFHGFAFDGEQAGTLLIIQFQFKLNGVDDRFGLFAGFAYLFLQQFLYLVLIGNRSLLLAEIETSNRPLRVAIIQFHNHAFLWIHYSFFLYHKDRYNPCESEEKDLSATPLNPYMTFLQEGRKTGFTNHR